MSRRFLNGVRLAVLTPAALGELGLIGTVLNYHNGTRVVPLVDEFETHTFTYSGTVAVATGVSRLYFEYPMNIETVRASVGTAPTGASLIADVKKNGTTIYTVSANRPTITASSNTATANTPTITALAAGDYLTVDVAQVGSTVAGSDLTVTIRARRT